MAENDTRNPTDAEEELRAGFSGAQKQLPSKFFYDEHGSELFEEITEQPEYYPTRAEQALLERQVPHWIAEQRPRALIELGAGSAAKTRVILDAMRAEGSGVVYVPVDISADFLDRTATELRAEYPGLEVIPIAADFTRTFELPNRLPEPALITFLGSTIGNFLPPDAIALLRRVAVVMRPDDRFLLGVDLRKDTTILEAAYNDARGVTAAFNLNLLRVINRRFGADFDLDRFRHRAIYNRQEHRIEMHLVSTEAQTVHLPGVGDFRLEAGETILTEISCKHNRASVTEMFGAAGLRMEGWAEAPGGLFALCLGASA